MQHLKQSELNADTKLALWHCRLIYSLDHIHTDRFITHFSVQLLGRAIVRKYVQANIDDVVRCREVFDFL